MKNKVISLMLAVAFIVTALSMTAVSAFAAGTSLTVTKLSESDSTVTVAVGVSGNSGIAALGVNLSYDPTLLKGTSVSSAGVASDAGMAVFGNFSDGNVRIIIDESNSGEGTRKDGTVCVVTFSKLSTIEKGTTADFAASAISSATYGIDGDSVEISDGSASLTLEKAESTTKKPTTTQKPVVIQPVVTTSPTTLPRVTVPTTVKESTTEETTTEEVTTEEMTTEEVTTEEWTTEYESYSYTAPENNETTEDDDEKSDNTKRIIAIVVVVVCAGAAAALYFTKRK